MNGYYITNIGYIICSDFFRQTQHSLQVQFEFVKSVHLDMVDTLKHFISVTFEFWILNTHPPMNPPKLRLKHILKYVDVICYH
jgi:hypothetical protein